MGIAVCLIFLMWFASGVVLMYFGFPEVRPQDRLDHSPRLDPSQIRLSPAQSFSKLRTTIAPRQVRLDMYDGRPLYIFQVGREQKRVYADSGAVQDSVTPESASSFL